MRRIKFWSPRLMFVLAVMFTVGSALSACNTTEGFGQDVKNTGSAIKDSAQENK